MQTGKVQIATGTMNRQTEQSSLELNPIKEL